MAKNPCKYLIEIAKGEFKEFTEPELKDYLLSQDLSKLKSIQNAIQERAAEEKVSRPTGAGKNIPEGGEGVRPSKQRTKITEKGGVEGYEKVNDFLYKGSDKSKKMSLLKRLMDADIPQSYKDALSKKGLDYKVSNQVEASNVAKSMVNELGVYDALDVARNNMVDPSVGSAIFGKAIDKIYLDEITLRSQGRIEEADILAQQWADTSIEYAKISNSGGKWNAQIAYFYKTSPMGFVMRVNNERAEQFKEWFANKEEGYKEVFDDIIKSEEGQKLLLEEVEGLRKSERQVERKKRDKSIDDFFEKAKLKTNVSYATIIPPQVWNGAMDVMKVSVKAGDRVVVSIQKAIEYIDKNLGGKEWDKDRFRKDYEAQLSKITEEKADVDIDRQAKQYLDKFRSKLKGLNQDQQEAIVKKSIKKLAESGALEYDDFKNIISETLGIKSLTPEQIQRIEKLTKETNISDDVEQAFLDAPSRETIDAYKLAKQKSLESDKELFELTYNNADVTGTLKSILTLNLMGAGTVIKNYGSNVLYQGTIRFPKSLIAIGIDKTIYGSSLMLNKFVGTKVIKKQLSLTDAQLGYFKEYNEGLVRGMDQMIKGVDEKDYFGSSQYASRLNPKKSLQDIKAALKGEIFLSNAQKWDKGIQATLGWQPYAVSRLMIYGDKPPRYAAQGAMAMQIGHNELGITNPLEMEAFMLSPEKYAYNILMKTGEIKGKAGAFEKMTSDEASKISKNINDRIIEAGAVATFQNENYASIINNFIDKSLAVTKESPMVVKLASPPIALLKATQLPFVKTPANIIWAYVKLANPAFTAVKALGEVSYAQYLKSKGNIVEARKYGNKSKDSMATTILGMAISAAAISFASQGLVRTKSSEKDTERETAGEAFFGKDNELNIGKMLGTDDFWVDLSWFPGIGAILDTQARIIEDNKAKALKGEKVEEYPFGYDMLGTLGYSFSSSLNTLVLDQGARVVNAIRSGEKAAENWSMNTLNTVSNAFTGGTFSTLSRALLPEKPSTKADNMWERIQNEQKTRNAVIRFFAGRPPSKISIWGEPIANNNSIIGSFLGYEAGSNNKFGAILYDDAQRTGNDKFFPAPEDYKIKINGKDQKLTEEQKMKLDMYIGQARKNIASPYIYDMGKLPEYEAKYSDLSDQDKLDALDVIYNMGKDAGFAKFKEEYKQFQDAEINVEEIIKKAEQSAKKTLFKVSLMDNQ